MNQNYVCEDEHNTIRFYRADFPDVDPNVVYRYADIQELGYKIYNSSEIDDVHQGALKHWGMPVRMTKRVFDFDKIKDEYGFAKTPYIQAHGHLYKVFSDGERKVSILQQDVENYKKDAEKDFYILSLKEIATIPCKLHLYNLLQAATFIELGVKMCYGGYYELSSEQVFALKNIKDGIDLIDELSFEKPNLFISITINE